jgi:hypothetical protein
MVAASVATVPYPTPEQVRAYIKVPTTALSDDDLELMLQTAIGDQVERCTWGQDDGRDDAEAVPAPLVVAVYRRVQRDVAARNLPLGMVGVESEYGPRSVPALDALVEHHERPWRRVVLA